MIWHPAAAASIDLLPESINRLIGIGLLAGIIIGKFTEYFTSFDFGPVISIKDRGMTGPATVVIQGLGVGMIGTAVPTVIIVVAICACNALGATRTALASGPRTNPNRGRGGAV